MKMAMLTMLFVLASVTQSLASSGDSNKMSEFRKAQVESCGMGANPMNRMGCMTWMAPADRSDSTGTVKTVRTPAPAPSARKPTR